MVGYTLPLLLLQLISPILKLPRDSFDAADLLNAPSFDVPGVAVVALRFRQFHDSVGSVVVDAFTKHLQHFNGSA